MISFSNILANCIKRPSAADGPFSHAWSHFRSALDGVLKNLHAKGIGIVRKKIEIVSEEMEESMLKKRRYPKKLLNTIPYSFGLRFAQQSRQEYQQLRPDMIEISGTRS